MPSYTSSPPGPPSNLIDDVVVRIAGDSGDGMQITGAQFSAATALMGNDLATFPDFPSEIRAPAGTTYGVSGYQIHFASKDIGTPGDEPNVLIAMNPAALKVNLSTLKPGGLLIVNTAAFTAANLSKAGYESNPLENGGLDGFQVLPIDITALTLQAVEGFGLSSKDALRCKNMWTLGLLYWLFGRKRGPTIAWLREKFANKEAIAEANIAALNAGHIYGESSELAGVHAWRVPEAKVAPGCYRTIDGNQATAWGLLVGAHLASLPLYYASYPITPASSLLHSLARLKRFGVTTFQAEDEIAAIGSAIGASFGGAIGVTGTSGPGLALKTEALGLAIATELPLVIVNVQRGGPSTGLPTKTEQSDLLQAVWGRNGDSPLVVLAAATPSDGFAMAVEALRLATKFMTPVILLSDGYLANGAEPWRIPNVSEMEPFPVCHCTDPDMARLSNRDAETLARPWAIPGTPAMQHRIGGLERDQTTGNISYDAGNHHTMTKLRAEKIARVANHIPTAELDQGEEGAELVIVSWGSSYGAAHQAVADAIAKGRSVAHMHLRYIWPLQRGIGTLLRSFRHVMVPEMNNGMLVKILRSELCIEAIGFNKIAGQPFAVRELREEIERRLDGSAAKRGLA